jgi:hypothetical protein
MRRRRHPFPKFLHARPGLVGALMLVFLGAGPLAADNDWLGIEVPQPLDKGQVSLNVRLDQSERQYWAVGSTGYAMFDAQGVQDQQDLITIDTRVDWRLFARLALELDVPTVFSQVSPYSTQAQYYNVDTPGVYASEGLGDLRFGLRGAWADRVQGFNAGWTVSAVLPTGLGPQDAPALLANTGDASKRARARPWRRIPLSRGARREASHCPRAGSGWGRAMDSTRWPAWPGSGTTTTPSASPWPARPKGTG